MERILLSGGAGFLGSHLCDRLWNEGHEVICLDNFFTSSRLNIEHLIGRPRFEFIRHDVVEPFRVECDRIVNLACPAAPGHYQHNPIKTTQISFLGTLHALQLAQHLRVPILQCSTSEVYGNPSIHPQPEDYVGCVNPIGPRSCYDEGKRVAESLCFDFRRHENVDVRVARIFNTYGPRMHPYDGRVISNFMRQAFLGMDLTVYGAGEQTRSFCYVSDMVEGLVRFLYLENPPLRKPINLGNPEEFSILEVANIIATEVNRGGKVETWERTMPEDDPVRRRPNISLANQFLDWEPVVPLRAGLQKTAEWYQGICLDDYRPPTPRY